MHDAWSQVQKTSIEEKVKSLEEAVERYADVLREDREGTREMRRAALVAFFEKKAPSAVGRVDEFMDKMNGSININTWYRSWQPLSKWT